MEVMWVGDIRGEMGRWDEVGWVGGAYFLTL